MKATRRQILTTLVTLAASTRAHAQTNEPTSDNAPSATPAVASETAQGFTVTQSMLLPGTRWQTPLHTLHSTVPGPTVVVLSGVHGDELAGPLAADELVKRGVIRHGTLIVVPRCNPPALQRGTRLTPESKYPNLNRNFPREAGIPPRGMMAETLWALLEATKPALLLDLHEGFDYNATNRRSVGNTVLEVPSPIARWLSMRAVYEVNKLIAVPGQRFRSGRRPTESSVIRSAFDVLGVDGMILETTKKTPLEQRVAQHLLMVNAILLALEEDVATRSTGPAASGEPPPTPSAQPAPNPPSPDVDGAPHAKR